MCTYNPSVVSVDGVEIFDADLPVFVILTDHARDEVNVDLREAGIAGPLVRAEDFLGPVGAVVQF